MHSASGGAGGSIIDILEVCESDFSKNLAAEETQEADALAVYEKETQDNKMANTMKTQDAKYKTNTELGAVLDYYAKIKERCVAKPESYEERKTRREAEIKGLKEALEILESETAFMQRSRRGRRGHHFIAL